MCGIAGIIRFDDVPVSAKVIQHMTDTLSRRGPDDQGTYCESGIGLGFRRLAVIDLSTAGHQPMFNEDKTVALVYNGEIYNFRELRSELQKLGYKFHSQTDSEVLLRAYEAYGMDCLKRIDGMFAFAIWDRRQKRLFLARDRFGIKPLHYMIRGCLFAFASEIKALKHVPLFSSEMDPLAIWDYFSYMQIPAPRTIYRCIRKMLPGHAMSVDISGQMKTWCYWKLTLEEDSGVSEEMWCEELRHNLETAVSRHLVADVPVGVFLSGGLDSSLIAAYGSRAHSAPLKTFSVRFQDNPAFDEGRYQRLVANTFGTDHYEFCATVNALHALEDVLLACDEPFAITSAIPLYYICKAARQLVTVVLTGDGGDELFAGYESRYRWFDRLEKLDWVPSFIWRIQKYVLMHCLSEDQRLSTLGRRMLRLSDLGLLDADRRYLSFMSYLTDQQKKSLLHPDLVHEIEREQDGIPTHWLHGAPSKGVLRQSYLELTSFLPDEMLTKTDRCASFHSLEGRVPFLDKTLVESAFRIPSRLKFDGNKGKLILRKASEPVLPAEIVSRAKAGFDVPIGSWLQFMNKEDRIRRPSEIINRTYLKKIEGMHHKGLRDWGHALWMVAVFNKWLEMNES